MGYGAWGIRVLSESGPVRGAGRGRVSRRGGVCVLITTSNITNENERTRTVTERKKEQKSVRKPESMQWNKWNGTQKK